MPTAIRTLLVLLGLLGPALPAAAQNPHGTPVDQVAEEYEERFREGIDALESGRYDEGIAAFERCLELSPKDSTCAYNIACGHSLKKEVDEGFVWLGRAIDWGFGFPEGNLEHLEVKDTDLDGLRADERFGKLVERGKELKQNAEDYASVPGVYVPAALAEAETLPLLVVLHDTGSTKDEVLAGPWRRVADELGYALVAPSGRYPVALEPANGMAWAPSVARYASDSRTYDKTVSDAVDAFRREHEVDRERVIIVGDGLSCQVAFRLATFTPGLYRGCILLNGAWHPSLVTRAQYAANRGLRLRILLERGRPLFGFSPDVQPSLVLNTLGAFVKDWGYTDPVRMYQLDEEDPDALHTELVGEVKAFSKAD